MTGVVTAVELSDANDHLYVSRLLRRDYAVDQVVPPLSVATATVGKDRGQFPNDAGRRYSCNQSVAVTVSAGLLRHFQHREWTVGGGEINNKALPFSPVTRNDKLSTPELHALIRRQQQRHGLRKPSLGYSTRSISEDLRRKMSPTTSWKRQLIPDTDRVDRKSFRRTESASFFNDDHVPSGDRKQTAQRNFSQSDSMVRSWTELDGCPRRPMVAAKVPEIDSMTSQRIASLIGDRPRAANFVDVVRRVHSRPGRQKTNFSSAMQGNGDQSLPELPEVQDNISIAAAVVDRKTSTGVTAISSTGCSRPSTAASATFFANIRELNEKIVSGKLSRKASVVFAGSTRPASIENGSSRCNSVQSRRESTSLVANSHNNAASVSDLPTAPAVDSWEKSDERAPDEVKNENVESGGRSRRRRRGGGIGDKMHDNGQLTRRPALFYEAPLVPFAQQNTLCKFYAGSKDRYKLPDRLPDRLLIN